MKNGSSSEVSLYPSDTLLWESHPFDDGELLVNPNSFTNVDPIDVIKNYMRFTWRHTRLGEGLEGEVRAVGSSVAVKKFRQSKYTSRGTIGDLAINVGIAEGLKQLQPTESNYQIRGLDIVAAYYKHNEDKSLQDAYWIMERLKAATDRPSLDLPNCSVRNKLRDSALNLIGINACEAFYDDTPRTHNFVITRERSHTEPGELVLIDARANKVKT